MIMIFMISIMIIMIIMTSMISMIIIIIFMIMIIMIMIIIIIFIEIIIVNSNFIMIIIIILIIDNNNKNKSSCVGHTGTSERHHDVVFIEFMKQKEFAERLDNFNLDERLVEIDYQSRLCEKTGSHLKNLIQKLMKEKVTNNFFFFLFQRVRGKICIIY